MLPARGSLSERLETASFSSLRRSIPVEEGRGARSELDIRGAASAGAGTVRRGGAGAGTGTAGASSLRAKKRLERESRGGEGTLSAAVVLRPRCATSSQVCCPFSFGVELWVGSAGSPATMPVSGSSSGLRS